MEAKWHPVSEAPCLRYAPTSPIVMGMAEERPALEEWSPIEERSTIEE
jgi:hypothetical protein